MNIRQSLNRFSDRNFPFPGRSILLLVLCVTAPLLVKPQTALPQCGTADSVLLYRVGKYMGTMPGLPTARTNMGETLVYRLAIDVNYATYVSYRGDKIQISKTVHEFVNKASEVFEREVNIKLLVSDLLIWDTPEPYPLTTDYEYYTSISDYWSTHRPGDRDCVVSLSARGGWFYGGGRMCTSNFPSPDNSLLPVDLLCHELGHTLGSPHTHSCYWPGGPIDVCAETEGQTRECTSPYVDYVNGSIMSYCRSLLQFHPYCRNLMRDYAEGKVQELFFSLYGFSPANTINLNLETESYPAISPVPAFSWRSTFRAGNFRFQVARDPGFLDIVEDTLLAQPFYHSERLSGGPQFARVRSESGGEPGGWSNPVPFEMPDFNDHRLPPVLINPRVFPDGRVVTSFRNEPAADAYHVEIFSPYSGAVLSSAEGQTTTGPVQQVVLNSSHQSSLIRIRVRYGQVWSQWSPFPPTLYREWGNELNLSSPLVNTSANPILSFQNLYGQEHLGLTHHLEVALDAGFSRIVTRDSVLSNQLLSYSTSKIRFNPKLTENDQYFFRVRTSPQPGKYSDWMQYSLETGREDRRFEYLGSISKFSNSYSISPQMNLAAKFLKSGNRLYVYGDNSSGYFVTSDLQTWEERTGRATKGKIPYSYHAFGVSPLGETFMLHPPRTIVKSNPDGTIGYSEMSQDLYLYQAIQACVTPDNGLFFIVPNVGIAQVLNGNLRYFRHETFPSPLALALAGAPDGRLWALMDGGLVYVFQDGIWSRHSDFPYWTGAVSFCFDGNGDVFIYGESGIAKLNGQNWENIQAVKDHPVRKAVFDDKNQLWMASYRSQDRETFESYALMKLKEGKLTRYDDGLNFLKEAFDIEYFNGQLVIMTSGGEIHSFDETRIQRFVPLANYCHGDEISVTVTSNSSFGNENRFGMELINTETGISSNLEPTVDGRDQLRAFIPAEIPEGSYKIRTSSSSPEIKSNESGPFNIHARLIPEVTQEAVGNFKKRLTTVPGEGYTYQWLLEDNPIAGETGPELEVTRSGNYSLVTTNKGGCETVSERVSISIVEPAGLTLMQNTPNPFSGGTAIAFYLPSARQAALEIFDLSGRKIAVLKEGLLSQGWHEVPVGADILSSGIYIYRLETPGGKRSLRAVKR